jgi:maleylacetate reductase
MLQTGVHRYPRHEEVVYGRPALEVLNERARRYGAKRLFVVTTRSLAGANGLGTRLAQGLGERCVGMFSAISAHSPRDEVVAAAAEARRLGCDLLVAVGGGSVIDATKVMQLCLWCGLSRAEQLEPYRLGTDHRDGDKIEPTVRMVAVPTTLSAAEFTPFAGITDRARRVKEGYAHPLFAPRAVVLDPAISRETPPALWFSTGIKAVDHAVEQLCHPDRAPYADSLAAEGLRLLARSLRATKQAPDELAPRLESQLGMWLAISGVAAGRGMGASHAIGHTLGGTYGVPHGLTSAVVLPAVLRWNESASGERQRLLSELLGEPARPAADCVRRLCEELGLPTTLAAVGIEPSQFRAIAEHTMHDRSIRSNARPIAGPEDIVSILEYAR